MSKSSKELLIVSILSALIIAAAGWAFNMNTKVSNIELQAAEREKSIEAQYRDFKQYIGSRFDQTEKRLDRIENKLDNPLPLAAGQ